MLDFSQLIDETGARLVKVRQGSIVENLTVGSPELPTITTIATLSAAKSNALAFINNARYRDDLASSNAGVVVMSEAFSTGFTGLALLHENPYWVYAKAACLFQQSNDHDVSEPSTDIALTACISESAKLGKGIKISAGVAIESDTEIGDCCKLAANSVVARGARLGNRVKLGVGAKVLRGCVLGDDVTVDAGAVIGSEGFGFAPYQADQQLRWQRIAQLGIVRIGSRVYIGANTTIDRGAIDDTVIEDDVIIDNQVQIAHNCQIGKGTAIAGCVGMAGSSIIGQRCSIGGGAGIAGHLRVADDTVVLGMTLINKSVKEKGAYASGTGMQRAEHWRKNAVRFTQLEKLNQRVKQLEKLLDTNEK